MFDFFDKIIGFISTAFAFFINVVESLFMALQMVASCITIPPFIAGFMPAVIASAILIFTAIYVIKFIIGR